MDMKIPVLSKEEIAPVISIRTYVVGMKIPILSREEIALDTSIHTYVVGMKIPRVGFFRANK